MKEYWLGFVMPDGVPRDHIYYGDNLEAALERCEEHNRYARSSIHWFVYNADDPEDLCCL